MAGKRFIVASVAFLVAAGPTGLASDEVCVDENNMPVYRIEDPSAVQYGFRGSGTTSTTIGVDVEDVTAYHNHHGTAGDQFAGEWTIDIRRTIGPDESGYCEKKWEKTSFEGSFNVVVPSILANYSCKFEREHIGAMTPTGWQSTPDKFLSRGVATVGGISFYTYYCDLFPFPDYFVNAAPEKVETEWHSNWYTGCRGLDGLAVTLHDDMEVCENAFPLPIEFPLVCEPDFKEFCAAVGNKAQNPHQSFQFEMGFSGRYDDGDGVMLEPV